MEKKRSKGKPTIKKVDRRINSLSSKVKILNTFTSILYYFSAIVVILIGIFIPYSNVVPNPIAYPVALFLVLIGVSGIYISIKLRAGQRPTLPKSRLPKKFIKLPWPVKLISIIYYLAAISTIFIGAIIALSSFLGKTFLNLFRIEDILSYASETNYIDSIITPFILNNLLLSGILLIILGILEIILARSFWKAKNWARITIIVLSAIGLISALVERDLFVIITSALISAYLIFSKNVKTIFHAKTI